MEAGSSARALSSSTLNFPFSICNSCSRHSQIFISQPNQSKNGNLQAKNRFHISHSRTLTVLRPLVAVTETLDQVSSSSGSFSPKIDKTGRFCSPRSARELSLLILYAACLEGSDPVRVFEKRLNAKRYPGFIFDQASLLEYDHMSFSGPPVSTETEEEAHELFLKNEKETANEADVLSAPPKLVYNKFVLRLTKKILEAVVDRWNQHILIMEKITPPGWKNEVASKILEHCILHLAMAEITVIGTRHQIVINEAVDLAKRFCDGNAPRIINGCLRSFIRDYMGAEGAAEP